MKSLSPSSVKVGAVHVIVRVEYTYGVWLFPEAFLFVMILLVHVLLISTPPTVVVIVPSADRSATGDGKFTVTCTSVSAASVFLLGEMVVLLSEL
ncbi:hypothetical protein IJ096_02780 [Candidatus Saccharibacteria bacterium]|nr:hypothetical protein [Candidatus Saccharibacteria bacterium]